MTIRKISKRRSAAGEVYSIKRSPLKKKNPKRIAKRKIAYRKMLASKEYKAARAEAMERAGNQCEYTETRPYAWHPTQNVVTHVEVRRCLATESLHAHHKSYPKTRPLQASDLTICCKPHHEYLESLKPHKQRMF